MHSAYEFLKFSWLVDDIEGDGGSFQPWHKDIDILPYPLPPEIGECGIAKLEMAYGMTLFRATHKFTPAALGQMVRMAMVEGSFPSESFMAQTVNAGIVIHHEEYPEKEVVFRPGFDLFRLSDRLKLVPSVDGSASSVMTALTVSRAAMAGLVGEGIAEATLTALGLIPGPSVVVRPIPAAVSAHLHTAFSSSLSGAVQRLTSQSQSLVYLSALIDHLGTNSDRHVIGAGSRNRARALHEQLINMQGKVPTLEELAGQFNLSVRTLNDEFKAEYGKPIQTFITDHRLNEAHAAIISTDIPLKSVALRLGYTHTNHFLTAFKKKFGYSPGSLRKKAGPDQSDD
jgi:AraC-like DNA-binding protein